jgi:hypothetical protein
MSKSVAVLPSKRESGVDVTDPAISSTWDNIRSDSNEMRWMLLGIRGNSLIELKASGSLNIDEMISAVNDDEILFGGFRIQVGESAKFYHFFFVGSNVSGVKKGKAPMYKSGVLQALEGAHGEVSFVEGKAGLSRAEIIAQLVRLTGTPASDIDL